MTQEVRGIVQENPVVLEQCCLFTLKQEDGSYLVVSTDRQASKDNIFVAKGQEMHIKGSVLEDRRFKGVLITEEARIKMYQKN